jgi:uncharacterized protein (DUF2141 family)
MTALLVCALLLQTPRDTAAQRPPLPGSGVIGGTVTTGGTIAPRPLRRAIVSLSGSGMVGARQTVTDETGRFAFDGLPPGRYSLAVEKPGYLTWYSGSRQPGRPPSAPIAIVDGQRLLDVAIDVPKGSVIEGTIRDERGVPQPSAQVSAFRVVSAMGERKLVPAGGRSQWVVTDDRGRYRIFGLAPGEYVVRSSVSAHGFPASTLTEAEFKAAEAQLQTGRPTTFTRPAGPELDHGLVYFPGVADPLSAESVILGIAEERLGVDIVNAPLESFRIEYTAVGPSGRPITRASIGLASLSHQSLVTSPGGVSIDANGHGVATRTPTGRYLFFGRGTDSDEPNAPVYWMEAEADVNGADSTGVILQFLPGQRISGTVRSVAASPVLAPTARVQLNAAPFIAGTAVGTPTAAVAADGSFTFVNVPPGRYRIEVGGIPGWTAMSALYKGVDTLDQPLEVKPSVDVENLAVSITNTLTEVSGLITDAAGRPTPELTVLAFSQDRNLWASPRRFSGATRIASDGKYRITGLPPGGYFLAIVTDIDPLQATDPMFLEQLMTGAVSIHLADGQKIVQDLKIGG